MSFYRISGGDGERGRGIPSPIEEHYTSLCFSLAVKLLVGTRDDFRKMFSSLSKSATTDGENNGTEEAFVEALAQPERFHVGESVELIKTEEIRLDVRRIGQGEIEATYYDQSSNTIVLRRVVSDEGSYLDDLDPYFWSIQVNGKATSKATITSILESPYAFKIDHKNRTINIKTQK
jgi:hypothetical protein